MRRGSACGPALERAGWTNPHGVGSDGGIDTASTSSSADEALVAAAVAGDREAFGAIYDRYADRIYSLCAHMLGDRTDAADATADVFLAASDHLAQLRDPAKLRPWLYAIARNEVYKRTRRKRREVPVDHGSAVMVNQATVDDPDAADPAEVVGLVRDAALGLDERDRLVLELTLAGGLDGDDLAAALGVSTDAAYQASHRMRERLARSVGAYLVARQGREDCDELQRVLAPWDGTFSVLWRKRVARHVDKCDVCERRRKAVPASLFGGTAFAAVAPLVAPSSIRDRVMASAGASTGAGAGASGAGGASGASGAGGAPTYATKHWGADGFPKAAASVAKPVAVGALGAVAAALLVVLVVIVSMGGGDSRVKTVGDARSTSSAPASSSAAPGDPTASTDASGSGGTAVAPGSTVAGQPGSAVTARPNGSTPDPTAPDGTGAGTTVPADRTPPTLSVSAPASLATAFERGCAPNPPLTAVASDPSGVVQVTVTYSGAASGTLSMSRSSGSNWSVGWTPPAEGSYSLRFTAVDGNGNAASATRSLRAGPCIG